MFHVGGGVKAHIKTQDKNLKPTLNRISADDPAPNQDPNNQNQVRNYGTAPSTTTPNIQTDPYTSSKAGQVTKPPQHAQKKTHKMSLSPIFTSCRDLKSFQQRSKSILPIRFQVRLHQEIRLGFPYPQTSIVVPFRILDNKETIDNNGTIPPPAQKSSFHR